MNREETKLLVENWRNLINETNHESEEQLNEGVVDIIKKVALPAITAIMLSQAAKTPVVSAQDTAVNSAEVAKQLNDAFNEASSFDGSTEIYVDKKGNVVGRVAGSHATFVRWSDVEKISKNELDNIVRSIVNGGGARRAKIMIKRAARDGGQTSTSSKSTNSVLDKIKNISKEEKLKIIEDFGKTHDNVVETMIVRTAAAKGFKKARVDKETYHVFLIMKYTDKYNDEYLK